MKYFQLVIPALALIGSMPSVVRGQCVGREWNTLNQEAEELYRAGKYDRAVEVAQKALRVAEQIPGPDHLNVATSLHNLAVLCRIQGEYAKAEPLFKRSLAILEKALGPDRPQVAASLENLAKLYRRTNRDSEAEALEQRAARIRALKRGSDEQ